MNEDPAISIPLLPAAFGTPLVGCPLSLLFEVCAPQMLQELGGEVFAFDQGASVMVLRQQGSTPFHHNVRVLRLDAVDKVLSSTPGPDGVDAEPLPTVDLRRCRDREHKALRVAQQEADKIGVGVSREAQQVFNALAKTLPCRWDAKTIVVLEDEVRWLRWGVWWGVW
jgi:hypothetical protein